jgi:glycine betaine/proline transport system permease protein
VNISKKSEDQLEANENQGLDQLIEEFVGSNPDYYRRQFNRIGNKSDFTWTFNFAAALFGPIWFGLRGLWKWGLPFTIVEAFALAQIGRGIWGDLTAEVASRIQMMELQLNLRRTQLEAAIESNSDKIDAYNRNINGLEEIVQQSQTELIQIEASRIWIIVLGIGLLVAIKIAQGIFANPALETRFSEWLSDRSLKSGVSLVRLLLSGLFVSLVYIASVAHFGTSGDIAFLQAFPTDPGIRLGTIKSIEAIFEYLNTNGEGVFDGISFIIRLVLDFLEAVFTQTPWIIVTSFVVALTALSAGLRAAIYAGAFLAITGLVGLWVLSMQTLALLGTAALIAIGLGIPMGIFCARRPRVYAIIRPILDFQQTMPAFVYMIPIIAFFGAGKPAAVVTCLIFGMPPTVRLTVLGLNGVPESIREAAIAYGASNWYLMTRIDLPLAAPSIRAGMNQTILLSLLTVVVASLIGAKGLGEKVLEALQYADVGQGLLAGFAILFLAMILDRVVQGRRKRV